MKLLTLNIRHGGGARINRIIDFIDASDADALIITEFRRNKSGRELAKYLELRGMHWVAPIPTNSQQNTVLIASKDIAPLELPSPPNDWSIQGASIGSLAVLGLYFPVKNLKEPIFHWLLEHAPNMRNTILMGDFNTGLNCIDLQGGSKFWCEDEFRKLSREMLTDAFRKLHHTSSEYSWFSRSDNGFRVDHSLVTHDLASKIAAVEYLHETRPEISDHSALLVELSEI